MEKTIDSGIMNSLVGERATEKELLDTPPPPSNEEGRTRHDKLDIKMDKPPEEDPFQDETDEESSKKKGRGPDKVKRRDKGDSEVAKATPKETKEKPVDEEKAKRKVDYGALAMERQKRQAQERENAALREQIAKLSQPQQQQVQAPDPNVDPLGAINYNQQQINHKLNTFEQQSAQQQQQQKAAHEFQQLDNVFTNAMQNFKQVQPDAEDAFHYAWQSREQELTIQGIPPQKAKDIVTGEYINGLIYALDNGIDPAQYAYDIAQTRGYRPVQQSPVAQKFNNIQKGMNANRGLPNGSHGQSTDTGIEKFAHIPFGSLLSDAQTRGGGKITRALNKYNRQFNS